MTECESCRKKTWDLVYSRRYHIWICSECVDDEINARDKELEERRLRNDPNKQK